MIKSNFRYFFFVFLFVLLSFINLIRFARSRIEEASAQDANLLVWQTESVSLEASDFRILVNNFDFLNNAEDLSLTSSPLFEGRTTLEAIWHEHNKEMRLLIYFHSNGTHWWSPEIRTYDGHDPGNWLYYTSDEGFLKTSLGQVYTNQDLTLISDDGAATLHFEDLSLQVSFVETTPTPIPTAPPLSPIGEQETLIVMFNFQDNPNDKPFTSEEVRSAFFDGEQSLSRYYRDVSYEQAWFTGEAVGWYTVPYNSVPECMAASGTKAAEDIARAEGVDVDSYPRRVYIHPFVDNCSSSGGIDGNPSETTLSGTVDLYTAVHEIGHNLILGHAGNIECGEKAIDDYNNCSINYYGDFYSPMGSGGAVHHHAFHKISLGWIPPSRVQEVTGSGTYTIHLLEEPTIEIQVLKIQKPDTGEDYYLEYRQPVNWDSNLPPGVTSGALIHIGFCTPFTIDSTTLCKPESYLIDATPASPNFFYDAALEDGMSFFDEINGITITQLSHDENSVTVSVDLAELSPTPIPTLDPCFADVNDDGVVDSEDMRQVLVQYSVIVDGFPEDINSDNKLNSLDLASIIHAWGTNCD